MPKTFYLTTAIDYTNGPPHIGHAYEKILADVIARYQRLKTDEKGERQKVYFLTGVDQHGQKVQQSAEKAGVGPQEFVEEITAKFIALWEKLEVKYDGWAATTDPLHKRCVQGILQRLYDEGQIYKDKQEGYYSIRQEQFLTDKERGPDGEFGPEWGEVEQRTEENYYFRLAQHKEWLLDYLRRTPGCVTPDFRQTELINAVEKLSGDLCISRPKSRLSWGIELPFDPGYVNYVWFDALTNYISFIGYDPSRSTINDQPSTFLDKWPALHIIGKDILIPAHGIYWPIMLHALRFPDGSKEGEPDMMPKFLVHGWWNISGAKMSKSLGNVVDPKELAEEYGVVAVRYYLMSDIVTGQNANFSIERLITVFNVTLANSVGNLLNRSLSMLQRYCSGEVNTAEIGDIVQRNAEYNLQAYQFCMDGVAIGGQAEISWEGIEGTEDLDPTKKLYGALGRVDSFVTYLNQLIEQSAPWKIAKDPARDSELAALLYSLAESLRIIAILISPVLPRAAHGIFDQLLWKMELSGDESRFSLADAEWGKLPDGHIVGKPTPLFSRIEVAMDP